MSCNCNDCLKLNEKQRELRKLAQPLIEFLRENYNPHSSIIIDYDFAKVVIDEIGIPFEVED